ncbi:MAG: TonB family protein [Zoogloeaceae bacterium]|jgi:TonB family protein|nr:TonB family protein [Zoogloeaceae bacterium]
MHTFYKDARLAQMLLYSVLAHVLLLGVARLSPPPYTARSEEGLTVSLRVETPSAPASTLPSAPPPASSTAPEVTPPPILRRPLHTPSPVAPPERAATLVRRGELWSPAPSVTPPERASTPLEALDAPADTDVGAAAQTLPAGAGQGAQVAEGQMAEGMADALPAYLLAIGDNARKLRRYPERAKELGHEGRVDIRLIWRPGMGVPQVELQQGSGSALLDRQGLNMLRQAAAHTPLPEALRQRAFSLVLPVEFSLRQPESRIGNQ